MSHVCYFCGQPAVRYGSPTARILELLREDGGWWTRQALMSRLGLPRTTVYKAISRNRGVLESRPAGGSSWREYRWVTDE